MANSKEYRKRYREIHSQELKERKRLWNNSVEGRESKKRWNHSLKGKEYYRNWQKNHKESLREYYSKWKQSLIGKLYCRINQSNRNSKTKDLTIATVQQVYEDNIKQYGTLTCYLCLNPIPFGKDQLEHKLPISRGGTNEYNNLGVSCQRCNSRKGRKTEYEFRNQQ